jgi:glycosyltransferase involved in cell wall biosynthesis
MPKVSVIIPTYNQSHCIERSLNSAQEQTFKDIEILVCDDASTDDTKDKIRAFQKEDTRVKLLCLNKNQGAGAARNIGLEAATGKYIAFLDSDDEWLPDKIFQQVKRLDSEPEEVGVCFCGAYIIKNGDSEKKTIYKPDKSWEKDTYKKMVLDKIFFLTPTIFFRKSCLKKSGMMRAEMRRNQDAEFLLRIFRFYKLTIISDIHAIIHLVVSSELKKVYERTKQAYPFWELNYEMIKDEIGPYPALFFRCLHKTILLDLALREKKWKEVSRNLYARLKSFPFFFPKEVYILAKSIGYMVYKS